MPFDAQVFRVMIASPGDVSGERQIIREVLAEWNAIHADSRKTVLLPLGWETHSSPSMEDRPQAIINTQVLKDADLLVGVFWTRIGTETGRYISGSVEEIEEHIAAKKPTMLYFSSAPVPQSNLDTNQLEALRRFKDSCRQRGLCEGFANAQEFREKFNRQLQLKLIQDAYFSKGEASIGSESADPKGMPEVTALSPKARILLTEAKASSNGMIRRLKDGLKKKFHVNGKDLDEDGSPRSVAAWESAISDLERSDLIKVSDTNPNVYRITDAGFKVADSLGSPPMALETKPDHI